MEIKSLKLCLHLLWMFLAICQGQEEDNTESLKTNLSLTYHDGHSSLFAFTNVQGVCSAQFSPQATLFLIAKSKNDTILAEIWFQGLISLQLRNLMGLVTQMVNVTWADGTTEEKKGIAFKFCLKEEITFVCALRSLKGKRLNHTSTKTIVASTRPRLPILVVDFHLERKTIIQNTILRVGCAGVVGTRGSIILTLSSKVGFQEHNWNISLDGQISGDTQLGHITFKTGMSTMGPTLSVLLQLKTTPDLAGRTFICTTTNNRNEYLDKLASEDILKVITVPALPVLNMRQTRTLFEVWNMEGYCMSNNRSISNIGVAARTIYETYVFMQDKKMNFIDGAFKLRTNPTGVSLAPFIYPETVNNSLRLAIKTGVHILHKHVDILCRVGTLQVCRTYKYKPASVDNIKIENANQDQDLDVDALRNVLAIFVLVVLGLVVGIFIALVIDAMQGK